MAYTELGGTVAFGSLRGPATRARAQLWSARDFRPRPIHKGSGRSAFHGETFASPGAERPTKGKLPSVYRVWPRNGPHALSLYLIHTPRSTAVRVGQ